MRKVILKKHKSLEDRMKSLSMTSHSEDQQCKTRVVKGFSYELRTPKDPEPKVMAPEIFITKSYDSRRKIERFRFRVKGSFYLTHKRKLYEVRFRHYLDIKLVWKAKDFSPKKSAVLTE